MHYRTISLLVLVLILGEIAAFGAWSDRTVGLPPVEIVSTKMIGGNGNIRAVAQDKMGRIFLGSDRLFVFNGQNWHAFPRLNGAFLTSLIVSEDGVLWAGATNELGFFKEKQLGVFEFHSLRQALPKEFNEIGMVWACAPVGGIVYFICQDKLLRWDGQTIQVTLFKTSARLLPMKMGNEWWFDHVESGLYRLTIEGPKLQIPSDKLRSYGVFGLFRDEIGLVTVSNDGFIRPGDSNAPISDPDLNEYLQKHLVSAYSELPNGDLAIGTVSGGMVLATRGGKVLQIWDASSGLPGSSVLSLTIDNKGGILGATPTDFFHFFANGEATLFNEKNGLTGDVVNCLSTWKSEIYAITEDGVFRQSSSPKSKPMFQPIPSLSGVFSSMAPYREGLLLSRFAGVDWFDGSKEQSIYTDYVGNAGIILPSKINPKHFYVSESSGLTVMDEQPNGSLTRAHVLDLPETCTSLVEDLRGQIWLSTFSRGVSIYDPVTKVLLPVNNPINGKPLLGRTSILSNDQRILIFSESGVLQADAYGHDLHLIKNVPSLMALDFAYVPHEQNTFISYQCNPGGTQLSYGAGILSFADENQPSWQELDVPSLGSIGPVRSLIFSEENNRPILWLGGTEGILRLDYDKIGHLKPPPPPMVRVNDSLTSEPVEYLNQPFPYKDHHVELMVFTGDYAQGKDWLIQTRLDGGDWSNPSSQRSFEFTNLSEGDYRFEARAVNSANMASEPATMTFTILPPWYRSGGAYTGYASALALVVFGFIRIREQRIRTHNRELETQVANRTAELVKANAAKDEFLASVSHEIRNPMNGVIGIAESLKTDAMDPDSRHKFELLRQCAGHLSSLLESLLDFSRLQAGAVELESKPFDLYLLMESISAFTAAESEKRGIPVQIAISPAVPRQLTGDPLRIRQILLNFVTNALNFSDHGQIRVTVWCKAVSPGCTEVFFAVSDEGPGISPEEQKKLFTRFERGTAAQRGRVPGTGLGLALCRALAEKMGGRIWLESEVNAGSCFYFSALFALVDDAALSSPPVVPIGNQIFKNALVVDDEEYNRIALGDLLELLGFTVRTAANGQQALELAGGHAFDVIFLDYAMPGLSGLDVVRTVRALPNRSAQATIFAVTAFNTPDKRAQCLAAGMNGFLGKPVTMERLRHALDAASPQETNTSFSQGDTSTQANPQTRLQLLATKKGSSYEEELALYFSELGSELERLHLALQQENAHEAAHYTHLLYGRCAFVQGHALETVLRQIATIAASGRWEQARSLVREVQPLVTDLRLRLAADVPAALRALAR